MATVTTNSPGLGRVRRSDMPIGFTQLSQFSSGGVVNVSLLNAFLAIQGSKLWIDDAYSVGSEIVVSAHDVTIAGNGHGSTLVGTNAAGRVLVWGEVSGANAMRGHIDGFNIGGVGTAAIEFQSAPEMEIGVIRLVSGSTFTDGFIFSYFYGCQVGYMSTAGSTISGTCFLFQAAVNANSFGTLYTSGTVVGKNFWMESTGLTSVGNHFDVLCAQGGEIGLYIGGLYAVVSIGTYYTENVVRPLVLGDVASSRYPTNVRIDSMIASGAATNHPQYAQRKAGIELSYCYGIDIGSAKFIGLYQSGVSVTLTGGTPSLAARAVPRFNVDGTVHSIQVTRGGAGYGSAPTVAIAGQTGSGFAATANLSGGIVTSITVTDPGTGYTCPAYPTAIRFHSAQRVTVSSPFVTRGTVVDELWPYLVRAPSALSTSGVRINRDVSYLDPAGHDAAECDVYNAEGYGYVHYIEQVSDTDGAKRVTQYVPPEYT